MALKIDASSLFVRRFLKVLPDGVKFTEPGMLFGARRLPFQDIRCVLMSSDHVLSFQVGIEVFSIQTKPSKAKHTAAVEALLAGVRRVKLPPGSAVRYDSTP